MKTSEVTTDAELERRDADSVMRHVIEGVSLDPQVSRRVHERAAKITEEIHRVHGEIDDDTIHNLLRGDDEDDDL